jgi:hypothetical protein
MNPSTTGSADGGEDGDAAGSAALMTIDDDAVPMTTNDR